jgi:hypothetical protein
MSAQYDRQPARDWQAAPGDRWEDWENDEDRGHRRPRKRARILSPARVLLFLLVLLAGGAAFYGLFLEQSALQLPLSVAGLALVAVAMLLLGLSLGRAAAQLGRQGSGGRALLAALMGGTFLLGAAGAGNGATVLGVVIAL